MNTQFENFFSQQITKIKQSLQPILKQNIRDAIEDETGIKTVDKIAECIVKIEVFFVMINELQKDLNGQLLRKYSNNNIDRLKGCKLINTSDSDYLSIKKIKNAKLHTIKLVNTVEEIPSLFYNNRMTYWYYLTNRGKIIDTRLRYWYGDWGYKNSICHKLATYLKILDIIIIATNKRKKDFIPMIDYPDYRINYQTMTVDDLLKSKILNKTGFSLNIVGEIDMIDSKEQSSNNISYSDERYAMYKDSIVIKMRQSSPFVKKEITNIEEFLKKIDVKTQSGSLNKTNLSKYEFILKTPSYEYTINDTSCFGLFINKYKELLKKLPAIESIQRRKKTNINLTIEELLQSAKELDIAIQKHDGTSSNRFFTTLNDTEFIDVKSQTSQDMLDLNGMNNFVGIVNTGKTTFMLILAHALVKKGLKTALVLRDNEDVLTQVKELNKDKNIKCVPLIGNSDKKTHSAKIIDSNLTQLMYSPEDIDLSFMNDYRYKYGTYTCPLKAFVKEDTHSREKSIFNISKEHSRLLCDNLYYKKKNSNVSTRISCPFVYDCDSLKAYEEINSADIYITNTHSYIQTKMNKYFIEDEPRVSKYIYDTCDIVLKDESDAVLFAYDCLFTNSTSLLGNANHQSLLEKINEYRQYLIGNTTKLKKQRRIVTRIEETRNLAEEILQILSEKRIPSFITRGPITSAKVFDALVWILINDVSIIKNIEHISKEGKGIVNIQDLVNEDYQINEENRKKLREEFKNLSKFIYDESKIGYISENKNKKRDSKLIDKYSDFTSLLSSIYKHEALNEERENCYKYVIKTLNLCNPQTANFIDNSQNAKLIITDIITFAVALVKLESDFIELMGASSAVRSTLFSLSKEHVADIPAQKSYVKDYRGIIPTCPLEIFFGLSYDSQKESLEMISWDGVGRHIMNEFETLWNYLEGDLDNGINVGLFSGTSYMPTSPLYHIDIPPKYLMKPKNEKIMIIEEEFFPEKYDDGKYIFNSGTDKSSEKKSDKIYKGIAESLCRSYGGEKTKLSHYLKTHTKENRARILVSVGNYKDTIKLANYLYNLAKQKEDTNINIAYLKSDNSTMDYSSYDIPLHHGLKRSDIKHISNTNFNIVVVPQTALQRGINMVQFTTTNKNGSTEASFSCIIKTNRDYQVPNSHEYAVARVNHKLVKELIKMKNNNLTYDYSLAKEANALLKNLRSVYDDYYKTKYFGELLDDERAMLIGDLCVEDFQFIGRIIRGYSDATIINLDASFFRNYTKQGIKDDEKTSTVVAIKWMIDYIKQDIINTYNDSKNSELNKRTIDKLKEFEFLMEELYGPFLKGIGKMINKLF